MSKTHDAQVEQWEDEARSEVLSESRPVAGPRERPILFSANMVRAIFEGRKTQTRRVVDPSLFIETSNPDRIIEQSSHEFGPAAMKFARCPYGKPGDRLWVREMWCPRGNGKLEMERLQRPFFAADAAHGKPDGWRWRPSIHMPRWASRFTLEVTEVRVQRLQEISDRDAIAEGLPRDGGITGQTVRPGPRENFATLWDSINGERAGCSWETNPWVWCVSFRRLP